MLEPAAYGAAISFGPNTRNFRDIVAQLLSAEGAVVVRDGAEMTAFVERCLVEPAYATGSGACGPRSRGPAIGHTNRTLAAIDRLDASGP